MQNFAYYVLFSVDIRGVSYGHAAGTVHSVWWFDDLGLGSQQEKNISLLRNVQTCCGANPVSCAVSARDLFCWEHVMLKLIASATVPLLCLLCPLMVCCCYVWLDCSIMELMKGFFSIADAVVLEPLVGPSREYRLCLLHLSAAGCDGYIQCGES